MSNLCHLILFCWGFFLFVFLIGLGGEGWIVWPRRQRQKEKEGELVGAHEAWRSCILFTVCAFIHHQSEWFSRNTCLFVWTQWRGGGAVSLSLSECLRETMGVCVWGGVIWKSLASRSADFYHPSALHDNPGPPGNCDGTTIWPTDTCCKP